MIPKNVEYHIVINLTNMTETVAREKSMPYFVKRSTMELSVIPNPPGIKERVPATREEKKTWVESIKFILTFNA